LQGDDAVSDSSWQEEIARRVPLAQVIVGAMVIATLALLAVVAVVGPGDEQPGADDEVSVLTYVAAVVAVASIVVRLVVPAAIMTRGRENIVQGNWSLSQEQRAPASLLSFLENTGDAGKLWLLFLTRTIVSAAVLEGGTFVCLLAYFIDRSVLALAMSVALLLGLALHFPTRGSVIHWIEDQLRIVDHQRGLSR
jgi:hypothetical protein